jgi:hypothetical protein
VESGLIMDEFTALILRSLVGGHQARAGMKERNRALTEYEIARRAGYTSFSYVEFSTTPERDQVRDALDALEREGWITQWQRAGRYDTYVPTELGVRRANTLDLVHDGEVATVPADAAPHTEQESRATTLAPDVALSRLVQQLDEVLTLLRAIDAKLGRDH